MQTSQLQSAILALLHDRAPGKTICPSEAARAIAGPDKPSAWRPLMQPIRAAAIQLAHSGHIVITQHGRPIDPQTIKGPIRLRLR